MLKFFRIVSLLEGLSYIAILSVTFGFISRDFVSLLGMSHGILFMVYLVLLSATSDKQKWSLLVSVSLFLASIIPFAFIAAEVYLGRSNKACQETAKA